MKITIELEGDEIGHLETMIDNDLTFRNVSLGKYKWSEEEAKTIKVGIALTRAINDKFHNSLSEAINGKPV